MALMYDMKVTVAYIPKGRVIGLSKIARIADMVSKRLQLQERIGSDIADIMQMVTGAEDIAVLIEGCHSCMTAKICVFTFNNMFRIKCVYIFWYQIVYNGLVSL